MFNEIKESFEKSFDFMGKSSNKKVYEFTYKCELINDTDREDGSILSAIKSQTTDQLLSYVIKKMVSNKGYGGIACNTEWFFDDIKIYSYKNYRVAGVMVAISYNDHKPKFVSNDFGSEPVFFDINQKPELVSSDFNVFKDGNKWTVESEFTVSM
jgi:hypothetical protein